MKTYPHILIFDPRTRGHHLSWLRYMTEDFLSAGFRVTWAVDLRKESKNIIFSQLFDLINSVSILSVFDELNHWKGGSKIKSLTQCFIESGANEIMINLDEIASNCMRFAALGIYPPKILQGKINGFYFRPRFLENQFFPPGNIIKSIGFKRLFENKWFKNLYLLDEYMIKDFIGKYRSYKSRIYFLPDPWSGEFIHSSEEAKVKLGISKDRFVFLNYGIGDKRKGLHLVIRAMLQAPSDSKWFLLCAGEVGKNREIVYGLNELQSRGAAKIINRYISSDEEKMCFSASDVVLLPYIKHFGSSGVCSLAAAAGKMVIASNEGLVGKRVNEHNLGILFESGDVQDLKNSMNKASLLSKSNKQQFENSAIEYSKLCSREAFSRALLSPF